MIRLSVFMVGEDLRVWVETDQPGEKLSVAEPVPGVRTMSVCGSRRNWTEVHTSVTIAAVAPDQPGVCAKWRTRGREIETGAGGLMAIDAGDVHVTKSVSRPADFDVVRLSPQLVEDTQCELGLRASFRFRSPSPVDPVVMESIRAVILASACGASALEIESAVATLLENIVLRLGEFSIPPGVTKDAIADYRLRRVRDFLRENFATKPLLDDLAREAGLSKFWLCSRFRSAYGLSIGQYWAAARIGEATRRLESGASIRRVTAELGYVDEPLFNRTFKKHWGCPPGAWVNARARNAAATRSSYPPALGKEA